MDNKTAGIVSYLTLIGWVVALLARKEKTEYTAFHLRQMLGLIIFWIVLSIIFNIIAVATGIYQLGYIGSLITLVLWVIGLLGAIKEEKKLVPLIGEPSQKFLTFIN